MKAVSEYLDDAFRSWLGCSVTSCCGASRNHEPLRAEKCMTIEYGQPRLVPPPAFPELEERPLSRSQEWATRSRNFASRASSRGSFSMRRRLNTYNGFHGGRPPRKISIGAPQDFRHVENVMPRPAPTFRPLELSIYAPGDNQLSPILPFFFKPEDPAFPVDDICGSEYEPTHSRSESSLSFRIPRKPIRTSSRASSEWTAHFKPRPESLSAQELLAALESEMPKAPLPARLRALTAPPAYERVKSALHEKYELEQRLKDIDEAIEERQSLYFNSRPVSRATTVDRPVSITSIYEESQEPMPTVLPTFAQRAIIPLADQRPKTAPSRSVHIPTRHKSFTEASAAFSKPQPSFTSKAVLPPPPPLPMVLSQPPLRKKKSFSRVSNWLFPDPHSRNISLDSVTNNPKPVTPRDGFYQCVELKNTASTVSVSTVSTMDSELDAPTMLSTWSPQSTPGTLDKRDLVVHTFSMDLEGSRQEKSLELTRLRTFGEKEENDWRLKPMMVPLPGRNSVGVAF